MAVALTGGLAVLGALPLTGLALDTGDAGGAPLEEKVAGLLKTVDETADRLVAPLKPAPAPPAEAAPAPAAQAPAPEAQAANRAATPRQTAQDPATEPPIHGTNPHGQGSVAVVDLDPTAERPTGGDPSGSDSGEEIVVGRSRGEQREDGTYHGHITVLALFGNEVVGVDTSPGETRAGPLDPIQQGLLDPLCEGSGNNACVSAVRADSQTTSNGSTNRYTTARATIGGAQGLDIGAAESEGSISSDGQCQTSRGITNVANVNAGGTAVASVAQSGTESKACKGQEPQQTNTSRVIGLGGVGVPLPAAGCADGTPDTVTGIPTLAPIVCNADDTNSGQAPTPSGVREALSVFALATGTSSLLKTTTAASESRAQAPPAQCQDGVDNDGDGVIDSADPGCHTDGNAENPASYAPNDDDEANPPGSGNEGDGGDGPGSGSAGEGGSGRGPACSDNRDNDGDGLIDARDPGCHTDGNANNPASYDPGDTSEGGGGAGGRAAQCADGVDNDGDGVVDAADPGCHTDGDASNPDSYDPGDDSEGGGVAGDRAEGSLPMTGSNVLGLALVGLVLLAAGLRLRRPAGAH